MRLKFKMILLITSLIVFSICVFKFWKPEMGIIIDRTGFTKNNVNVIIDNAISRKDLYIYWHSETDDPKEFNQLLIYHFSKMQEIPSSYGKNFISIKYKNIVYNKIGLFKYQASSKHNYNISLKIENDNLIIDWYINNWYDPDIIQGSDTIKIE